MMLRIYLITLFFISVHIAMAQGDVNSQLGKIRNTYDTQRADNQIFNIENNDWYILRNNPAFHHYFTQSHFKSFDFRDLEDKNIVTGSLSLSKTSGKYPFYEGNKQSRGAVLGSGKMVLEGVGTLFGTASYTTEQKKNTLLNYAVSPQNYYPYLVGDTLGVGNRKYEIYYVDGGFSFAYGGVYYGVGASYQGVASSKLTDPRLSVYDSWFKLDFGITKSFHRHLVAVKVYPEFNRQTISASSTLFRAPSVLQFNGLGTWRLTEVKATQGYERLLTISGYGAEFAYKKLKEEHENWGYAFSLAYNYRKMNTEDNSQLGFESNTKLNLFSKVTHHISPTFSLNKKYPKVHLAFLFTGNNDISKGTEHVYKNEKVTGEQNLYNYIKVASNNFYTQYYFTNNISFKLMYLAGSMHTYHLLASMQHQYYEEKYLYPTKRIKNATLSPSLGLGYSGVFKKNSLAFNLVYTQRFALKNFYDISNMLNRINVEQSYIPFSIRGEAYYKIESELSYAYTLKNAQRIGMKAVATHISHNKDIASISPILYEAERDRNTFFFDFKLFYLF